MVATIDVKLPWEMQFITESDGQYCCMRKEMYVASIPIQRWCCNTARLVFVFPPGQRNCRFFVEGQFGENRDVVAKSRSRVWMSEAEINMWLMTPEVQEKKKHKAHMCCWRKKQETWSVVVVFATRHGSRPCPRRECDRVVIPVPPFYPDITLFPKPHQASKATQTDDPDDATDADEAIVADEATNALPTDTPTD